MRMRAARYRTGVFATLFAFIASCAWGLGTLLGPPKGYRYYLPEGYSGWICVSYQVAGAPPLPLEEGFLAHTIPPGGVLRTSSAPRFSPKIDAYFYYNASGTRKADELRIGGGYSEQKKGGQVITNYFWVSSGDLAADYERFVKGRDTGQTPPCGPWSTQKQKERQ